MDEWLVVPNFKRQVSTDEFYVSAMCFKDGIQWIFRANTGFGRSESYRATCPCCGGDCVAFGDKNSISSDDEIEVVGWLVDRKDELLLVALESISSTVEDVLQKIIETHDFSASFQTIKLIQSDVNLHLKRSRPSIKKLMSGTLLLQFSTSEIERPSESKQSTSKRQKRNESQSINEKKNTEDAKKNSSKSWNKSVQNSAKELLVRLQRVEREEKSVLNRKKLRKSFAAFQIGRWKREPTKSQANSSKKARVSFQTKKALRKNFCLRLESLTSPQKVIEPKQSKSQTKMENQSGDK